MRYKKFNYYKALGLKDEWRSTDAQIKKNYQKGISNVLVQVHDYEREVAQLVRKLKRFQLNDVGGND